MSGSTHIYIPFTLPSVGQTSQPLLRLIEHHVKSDESQKTRSVLTIRFGAKLSRYYIPADPSISATFYSRFFEFLIKIPAQDDAYIVNFVDQLTAVLSNRNFRWKE